MGRRVTHQDFVEKIFTLVKDEYEVIGEYVGNRTKIKMKHNKCGIEYEVEPKTFLKGSRCRECHNRKLKKTPEQFVEEVRKLVGDEYKVLGKYAKSNTKIKMKHNRCGNQYEVTPSKFLSGRRCSKCTFEKSNPTLSPHKKGKTHEEFVEEVFNLYADEYSVLGKYMGANVKIQMKHNKCSNKYEIIPSSFLRGAKCQKCSVKLRGEKRRKTHEQFLQEVYELVRNEYEVIGKYKKARDKIKMKHNECGFEYDVAPYSFFAGTRCPKCYKSEKKTPEQYVREVYDLVGNEYEVLSEYINNKVKVRIRHNKCNFEYNVTPSKFLHGRRCPKCSTKARLSKNRSSHEEFAEKLFNLVKDEYKILGSYVKSNNKIEIKHTTCGYEYKVTPAKFIAGRRCPKCFGNDKKTHEEFITEIFSLVQNEYQVLSEYINTNTKIEIKHTTCGYEYKVTPAKFIAGRRCPQCHFKLIGDRNRKSHKTFVLEVHTLVANEYDVLEKYQGTDTKIKMKHNVCGFEWSIIPDSFLRGNRCPRCSGNERKTHEKFVEEVFHLVESEYEVLSEYKKSHEKVKLRHNKCGNEYKVSPSHFLRGKRCPHCNISKGEHAIERWLRTHNIQYVIQYKFDDCIYRRRLPFDFALFNEDKLLMLIEFDGKQHFEPVEYFGGEEGFKMTQLRDNIKNEYCQKNNIPLLRIPYYDSENIENILESQIKTMLNVHSLK